MADRSGIEWTQASWNVVTGCTKISPGCKHCYAEREWKRLSANPSAKAYYGRHFTDVGFHPERLDQPLRWRRPRMIFVNSMSDLFHESLPDEVIEQTFAVMALALVLGLGHRFQVLTKRPQRAMRLLNRPAMPAILTCAMRELRPGLPGENSAPTWPLPNVWLGVSIEDQHAANARVMLLLQTLAALRWVSVEPMLGPVDLQCIRDSVLDEREGIAYYDALRGVAHDPNGKRWAGEGPKLDWVVAGGESGAKARETSIASMRAIVGQCRRAGTPLFCKQLGANVLGADSQETAQPADSARVKLADKKGGDPAEWPADLRVREYPRRPV